MLGSARRRDHSETTARRRPARRRRQGDCQHGDGRAACEEPADDCAQQASQQQPGQRAQQPAVEGRWHGDDAKPHRHRLRLSAGAGGDQHIRPVWLRPDQERCRVDGDDDVSGVRAEILGRRDAAIVRLPSICRKDSRVPARDGCAAVLTPRCRRGCSPGSPASGAVQAAVAPPGRCRSGRSRGRDAGRSYRRSPPGAPASPGAAHPLPAASCSSVPLHR